MKVKNVEPLVLETLERNPITREDDFILYGAVLKKMGVNLNESLSSFLARAKKCNLPSFESVTRCRRHITELRQDLKDAKTAVEREIKQEEYINYNRSDLK